MARLLQSRRLPAPVCLMLICLAWGPGAALAAEEPPTLTARVLHSQGAYAQGGSYPLALELTIRPGYHINTDRPQEPDVYPTKAVMQGAPDLSLSPAVFPAARSYKPAFSPKPMQVFDGVILLRATLSVARQAALGQRALKVTLDFQACDDQSCLMPEQLEVALPVKIVPAGQDGPALNPGVFKK